MDAILLAGGGANPKDPLYPLSSGRPKALLPIAGKPMAQWVLDALADSATMERVVIVGLAPGCGLTFPRDTLFAPDSGSILGNVRSGALASGAGDDPSRLALVVSSDIPALEPAMVDWIAARAQETGDDLQYCVIDRSVMDARFPGSGRSWVRFRDREVCGGDMTVIRPAAFLGSEGIWRRITEGRKSSLQMAAVIGIDVLLLFLLKRLTVADAARRAAARLGIRGRVLDCPYAEIGMDVDKPFQFTIVERALLDRARA
ncbi:MAG: nucleotidyltransferase family protein [Spirochaetes bacterium]|nr:nucleotidyltransferase family protein [Spirochaetota bacterium]